jgi:hypothetical protein
LRVGRTVANPSLRESSMPSNAILRFVTLTTALSVLGVVACAERDPGESASRTNDAILAAPAPTDGPVCAEASRRCTMTFAYADRGERSVELRGDFRSDGWNRGVALVKRGKTWSADVDVPYGRDVEYKLVLDGARWTRDPLRPGAAPGSDNSRVEAITCRPHRCEAP